MLRRNIDKITGHALWEHRFIIRIIQNFGGIAVIGSGDFRSEQVRQPDKRAQAIGRIHIVVGHSFDRVRVSRKHRTKCFAVVKARGFGGKIVGKINGKNEQAAFQLRDFAEQLREPFGEILAFVR